MAEREIKSREAKVNFDEDVLAGKKAKLDIHLTRNGVFIVSFSVRLV